MKKIIVVGGGQAGLQVCESVRREGFDGELSLICEEDSLPYQRPPLSKSFLLGDTDMERLSIRPPTFFRKYEIKYFLNTSVLSIDRKNKKVKLSNGNLMSYDNLVLTTGARIRQLGISNDNSKVFYIRDVQGSEALRSRLASIDNIAVIGGGFIGLEVAAVCRQLGKSVIVFEQSNSLMARGIPRPLASYYEEVHKEKGVHIALETTVEELKIDRNGIAISFNDNKLIVDAVVIGIGVIPNTELASDSGLRCQNGIVTDSEGRTNDNAIFAAGDCASFFSEYCKKHVRLESIQNAVDTGKVVAANMLGKEKQYDSVPWFWSDQYDLKLQIAGILEPYDDVVPTGSMQNNSFSSYYFYNGAHVGTASVNKPSDHMKSRKLLSVGSKLTAEVLRAPGFDLQSFAKEHS